MRQDVECNEPSTSCLILSEAKYLVTGMLGWGSAKARGYARDEILRCAQNDKDSGVACPHISILLQALLGGAYMYLVKARRTSSRVASITIGGLEWVACALVW